MFKKIHFYYHKLLEYELKIINIIRCYFINLYETYKRRKIILFLRQKYLKIKKIYVKYKLIKYLLDFVFWLLILILLLWQFEWVRYAGFYFLVFLVWLPQQILRFIYYFIITFFFYQIIFKWILFTIKLIIILLFTEPLFYSFLLGIIIGIFFYELEYFRWHRVIFNYMRLWVSGTNYFLEDAIRINRLFWEDSKKWQNEWYNSSQILWQYKNLNEKLKIKYLKIHKELQNIIFINLRLKQTISQLMKKNNKLNTYIKILEKENKYLRKKS